MDLEQRIDAAIERISSGQAPMRIPVEETDPDTVLADCAARIRELELALVASRKAEEEAAALLQEFVARVNRGEVRSRYTYGRFTDYLRSRQEAASKEAEDGAS